MQLTTGSTPQEIWLRIERNSGNGIGDHHETEGKRVAQSLKNKRQQMTEGLQLSRAFMQKYGFTSLPRPVIALWCGCSVENIRLIEERALRKLRRYGVFKRADLDWLCHIISRHYRVEV